MTQLVVALFLGGFGAGLVDSIAGGGGLISLPVLLAADLPEALAIGTNKGQAVFGAVSSATSFWRRGAIDRGRAPVAFSFGALGSLAGAALLSLMKPEALKPVVMVLLVVAAALVMVPKRERQGAEATLRHGVLLLALVAFGLGAYDGFFGPGVGTLLIVAFTWLFGDSLTRASANAKVVNLASNLAAFALFAARGKIIWTFALPMAAGNILGALVGSRLALRRGDRFVRVVVLLVVTGVVIKLGVGLLGRR